MDAVIDGIVIDANIISKFYKEFIIDEGDLYDLINWILDNCGVVFTDLIYHEWISTCNNYVIKEWITDGLKLGKIRYTNPQLDRAIIKKLHINLGLPKKKNGKKSHDIEYIKCANVTLTKYILTDDIDFFDPKLKNAKGKKKIDAKINRNGKLCRFLLKELKIRVGTPHHCVNDFNSFCEIT